MPDKIQVKRYFIRHILSHSQIHKPHLIAAGEPVLPGESPVEKSDKEDGRVGRAKGQQHRLIQIRDTALCVQDREIDLSEHKNQGQGIEREQRRLDPEPKGRAGGVYKAHKQKPAADSQGNN